jgi:hypothetical protein
MGLKDLFTGRSKNEQSDCCNVEIVPVEEDDRQQQNIDTEVSQQMDESCCQDTEEEG